MCSMTRQKTYLRNVNKCFFNVMDDLSRQVEEIEAIQSIYESEWTVIDEFTRTFQLIVGNRTPYLLQFQVTLPLTYPSSSLPTHNVIATWLKTDERKKLEAGLNEIAEENVGGEVLFLWIQFVKDFVNDKLEEYERIKALVNQEKPVTSNVTLMEKPQRNVPTIYHGESITDRKSTFQPHLANISHSYHVKDVTEELLKNRKIANATHNIMAYRIFNEKTSCFMQDCDDDGETAAGGRLLHLLQILDAKNVIVIVSRWYGGTHLGPDRFKHINNAARSILVEHGFVKKKQ